MDKKYFFEYDQEAIDHLKQKDKKLGEVIDQIGLIKRETYPDLFEAIIKSIVGQQISTKAQVTILRRLSDKIGTIEPKAIDALSTEELQSLGMSFRKVGYIKDFAEKVVNKEFDIDALHSMNDEEVSTTLSALNGIGPWTAEMMMIFSMQRPNILSYGDLAIHRGLRMIYRHRKIDKEKFQRFWKRYTPYASVASLYLWAVAGGHIEGITDPQTRKEVKKS
ncbi:DNA-3-methyladenine glycosylase [Flammeovirga sp. SubArs3]|uniref:DNA-3-methyladenine glycosylase family protein n=1 Tax=Flammeovirga sp. SubArs3 TaxID=2995316 RepID=UPI00248AD5B6|nr:DNA-3-methyladenine glycosylase [Flammeovirga sp. SubArs3]